MALLFQLIGLRKMALRNFLHEARPNVPFGMGGRLTANRIGIVQLLSFVLAEKDLALTGALFAVV